MNKYKTVIFLVSMLGMIGWFVMPHDIVPVFYRTTNYPVFSEESGFYEEPFYLTISTLGDCEIYYTLDGSIPNQNSYKYEEPIYIDDIDEKANVWAARDDVMEYFGDEPPAYEVDKACIIRAVAYNENGERGEVHNATYFVGKDIGEKNAYTNMAVISLITEPKNFFGYEQGIYVKGITTEKSSKNGNPDNVLPSEFAANYNNRGKEWEREVYIEYFSPQKEWCFSQNVGVRIKGTFSRSYAQKSINVYAREEYDGNNELKYDLFQTGIKESNLVFSACGDDKGTKLKDVLIADLTEQLDIFTVEAIPGVLFVNGEYWGVYWITERMDEEYLEKHYGVEEDNVVMIKNGELEEGEPEDYLLYKELLQYVATEDLSDDAVYARLEEMMDMKSFMEYYCVNLYVNNTDWPHNNTKLWRSREKGYGTYEDGKWRWVLYDLNTNSCMRADGIETASFTNAIEKDVFLPYLLQSNKFRKEFLETFERISREQLETNRICDTLLSKVLYMESAMEEDYRRFQNERTEDEDFWSNAEELYAFFANRQPYIEKDIMDVLGQYEMTVCK